MLSSETETKIEQLRLLSAPQVAAVAAEFGSPVFVYSEASLLERAREVSAFKAPFGLTARYAMKANPLAAILRIFHTAGLHIDASSGYEVHRAIHSGIPASHIMLTSQQLPDDLEELVRLGICFNATSLHQLETFGRALPGHHLAIRLNPGIGSGHSPKTNVGGPTSSFGIWHEDIDEAKHLAHAHGLTIDKLHTHIGAGTDPAVWHEAARLTLEMVEQFQDVTTVNLGGGFKVARMLSERGANIDDISAPVSELLSEFAERTGRQLHLEVEPGTYLVAGAGSLLASVIDTASTGEQGFDFLKLNVGLTELMRPALYAAQHPIIVVNDRPADPQNYVVVGHTCESGDLLTPQPGQPDVLGTRTLQHAAIGDAVVIEGVGAYCASMSAHGYNSFPDAAEVMMSASGTLTLAKQPFTLADHLARER